MKEYLYALQHCLNKGIDVDSRAGKVRKAFGHQMRFDLKKGFPALTTKKLAWKSVVSELLWFLEGSNDERRLAEILYEDDRENLKNRINVLITNQDKAIYPGADEYVSGDLISKIKLINTKYEKQDLFIIGGPKIIDQLFALVEEFYLTRIYGKFDCDKKIDLTKIEDAMILEKKIINDKICHFEIWKR